MCENRVLLGGFFAYFSYSAVFRTLLLLGARAGTYRPATRKRKAAGAVPTAIIYVVGLTGFEPATSRSRTERSTKLSHNP